MQSKKVVALALSSMMMLSSIPYSAAYAESLESSNQLQQNEISYTSEFDSLYIDFIGYINDKIITDYGTLQLDNIESLRVQYAESLAIDYVNSRVDPLHNVTDKTSYSTNVYDPMNKNTLLTEWTAGVLILRVAGFDVTADLMYRSLYNPSPAYFGTGTSISNKMRASSEINSLVNNMKTRMMSSGATSLTERTSVGFTSDRDL